MPIKGLTESRRFTRGGHLRLGTKAERGYPVKSDHFIADFENPDVEALFYQLYGTEPKRVTIAFGADESESIFPQYYKCYGAASGLKCKGDGQTAGRANANGEIEEVECATPQHCDFALRNGSHGKPGCKQMAALQFFIKGLPGIQVFQVNTTSFNSIVNINTGIDLLQTVRRGRSIRGVWVDLMLVEQAAQANGKAVTIYVMKLDIPVSLDNLNALECAFETPVALPAPDESRDELLTPTLPEAEVVQPAPTGPSEQAKQLFVDVCAEVGADHKEAWRDVVAYYGAPDWNHLTDADISGFCQRMQFPEFAPAPAPAPAPSPLTPIVTASHPDFIRFRTACEFAGVDHGRAMIELLTEHDTTEVGALPAGALIRRATEIETAAMPVASGFQV